MNFQQAITSGFQNYVNFKDRALRSEYWYWVLFAILVGIISGVLDGILFSGDPPAFSINTLTSLALFLPGIAVSVRRLHDVDRSGWWLLIGFTIIGIIPLLYWYCIPGTDGANTYGPSPSI